METLTPPESAIVSTDTSTDTDLKPDFHLLLAAARGRDLASEWKHLRRTAAMSVGFHVVLILVLFLAPDTPVKPLPERVAEHRITRLYIPSEFTQKAPNKGKVQKEIVLESSASRARIPSPVPTPKPVPLPPVKRQAVPKPVVPEPPKLVAEAPIVSPVQIAPAPPPPAPPAPAVQPKLSLEDIVPPPRPAQGVARGLAIPDTSVAGAVKDLARSGAAQGQSVPGILSQDSANGRGLQLPELKSDPMGVDFRPYLLQVLTAVRRNWFAVYPEAARLGQRGQVTIQFVISKDGTIPKIAFSAQSGSRPLDESAVAAISASNRLPPLPLDFRGDRIVVQMTFQYNMPR